MCNASGSDQCVCPLPSSTGLFFPQFRHVPHRYSPNPVPARHVCGFDHLATVFRVVFVWFVIFHLFQLSSVFSFLEFSVACVLVLFTWVTSCGYRLDPSGMYYWSTTGCLSPKEMQYFVFPAPLCTPFAVTVYLWQLHDHHCAPFHRERALLTCDSLVAMSSSPLSSSLMQSLLPPVILWWFTTPLQGSERQRLLPLPGGYGRISGNSNGLLPLVFGVQQLERADTDSVRHVGEIASKCGDRVGGLHRSGLVHELDSRTEDHQAVQCGIVQCGGKLSGPRCASDRG